MTELRSVEERDIVWQGIAIHITYEPDFLNMIASHGVGSAHLQVLATRPNRTPLPISETGYRSHFCDPVKMSNTGGPIPFVKSWLDHAARSQEWLDRAAAGAQLSLF